jgi:hypothetical protein
MKVLIACEFSEIVKEQFLLRGHDAHSCDLLPGEKGLPNHHQCDVRDILNDGWDLMIAHPPCTYLSNSGVRWLYEDNDRWEFMREACVFFNILLDARIPHIAVENPIQHKWARQIIPPYNQIIQPYQFGHGETKATCLWLKDLPKLIPTHNVSGRKGRVHFESPSPDRWKNRSRTLLGIAAAMAEQWGTNG